MDFKKPFGKFFTQFREKNKFLRNFFPRKNLRKNSIQFRGVLK